MILLKKIIDLTAAHRKMLLAAAGILLLLILLFNVFWGLGTGYIRNWDEARHGISACEMLDTGNYIVNTVDYQPDLWNVKPVFSFYGNLAGLLLFGRNIFAVRFFSALSYLLIGGMIFWFLRRAAGTAAAFAGCLAFAVAPSNWVHCFTTGDPDALFILFVFSSFLLLWGSLERGWLLPPAAFLMGLAFLTRSFHAGPYAMWSTVLVAVHLKRYRWTQLLAAFAAAVVPTVVWAAARYHADGLIFFQSMIELDLLGRLQSGTASEHGYSAWYTYLDRLNHFLFCIPIALIIAAVLAGVYFKGKNWMDERFRTLYCWCASYFVWIILFYSCCRVKLEWYIWPAIPFLAILIGLHFQNAADRLGSFDPADWKKILQYIANLLIAAAFVVWFGLGEGKAIRVIMTRPRQENVLQARPGEPAIYGKSFFLVSEDGKEFPLEQSFLLVMRFQFCKLIRGDLAAFKKSKVEADLICFFEEDLEPDTLRKKALDFARKNGLSMIRCADSQAIFRK